MEGIWFITYLALWIVVTCNVLLTLGVIRQFGISQLRPAAPTIPSAPAASPHESPIPIQIGIPAPDFTAQSPSNEEVKLSDFRGRWSLLFFANPACEHCVELINGALRTARISAGDISLLVVAAGTEEEARNLSSSLGSPVQIAMDTSMSIEEAFRVPGRPYAVLLNDKGIIRARSRVNDIHDIREMLEVEAKPQYSGAVAAREI